LKERQTTRTEKSHTSTHILICIEQKFRW